MTNFSESIYVIRKGDMLIRPRYDEYQQTSGAEIIRFDKSRKESPFKVQRIIERSCKFYGNSYLSKNLKLIELQVSLVNHLFYLPFISNLFFPTHSDRQDENIWINMHYIDNIKELKNRKVK